MEINTEKEYVAARKLFDQLPRVEGDIRDQSAEVFELYEALRDYRVSRWPPWGIPPDGEGDKNA